MKYKLYTDKIYDNPTKQILCGRGMNEDIIQDWIDASPENINNWRLLGEQDMVNAVCLVENTINSNDDILVVVD